MTDNLTKALSMLTAQASNPIALEALVKAMEASLEGKEYGSSGVASEVLVGAPVQQEDKPKHPLEDYQITEKDVGSLVTLWDEDEPPLTTKLLRVDEDNEYYPYKSANTNYEYAKPYLDPIALHFIPFYATEDSVAPDDLGKHYAVLWSNGDIELVLNVYNEGWTHKKLDEFWIVGYRPLKFVNPLGEV